MLTSQKLNVFLIYLEEIRSENTTDVSNSKLH